MIDERNNELSDSDIRSLDDAELDAVGGGLQVSAFGYTVQSWCTPYGREWVLYKGNDYVTGHFAY